MVVFSGLVALAAWLDMRSSCNSLRFNWVGSGSSSHRFFSLLLFETLHSLSLSPLSFGLKAAVSLARTPGAQLYRKDYATGRAPVACVCFTKTHSNKLMARYLIKQTSFFVALKWRAVLIQLYIVIIFLLILHQCVVLFQMHLFDILNNIFLFWVGYNFFPTKLFAVHSGIALTNWTGASVVLGTVVIRFDLK